jgi:type II secretory pathway pseudopilin PulG
MNRESEGGFTLVELVFGAAIMAVMVAAVGQLFVSNLSTVTLNKARTIGLALANEKIEALRDLPYDSLATQNGAIYPPGALLDNENITRNNYKFSVHTQIIYVDDPYDGNATGTIAGKPQDLYPYDYKKAQIDVTLVTSGTVVASLTSDIAGKAAETSSNTGILSITVLDANGIAIPNAVVTITNPSQSPAVNITTTTDSNGLVIVPRLPPDASNRYQVTATLAGYSTEGTIPDPAGAQNAVKLNPNVLVQQITALTLAIDRVSTLFINVKDTAGVAVPSLAITTTSSKKIKTNPDVFKYSVASTTDASGNILLTGMEWDAYSFALPAGYYLVSSTPYSPVALNPNGSLSVNLVVSNSSTFPRITAISPQTQPTGSTNVSVAITGANLSGSSVKLVKSGASDINCTGVSGTSTSITCSANLTGATTGAWDITVTTSGKTATQGGGFNVTP